MYKVGVGPGVSLASLCPLVSAQAVSPGSNGFVGWLPARLAIPRFMSTGARRAGVRFGQRVIHLFVAGIHEECALVDAEGEQIGLAGGGGWDSEGSIGRLLASEVSLEFPDLFEWGNVDYRDFRFYRVRIVSARDGPELSGREGLVDAYEVSVFVDHQEGAEQSAPAGTGDAGARSEA